VRSAEEREVCVWGEGAQRGRGATTRRAGNRRVAQPPLCRGARGCGGRARGLASLTRKQTHAQAHGKPRPGVQHELLDALVPLRADAELRRCWHACASWSKRWLRLSSIVHSPLLRLTARKIAFLPLLHITPATPSSLLGPYLDFAMKFGTIALVLSALAAANAHSQEEIDRKGAEIMEEYRTQRGTWVHALTQHDIDFMVDHIGSDGIAVAGFFVGPHYKASGPRFADRHQHTDDLFLVYKRLAEDQSWLKDAMNMHKTYTFAFSHDRELADDNGCGGDGLANRWDHVCLVVWKTSKSGQSIKTFPATALTEEGKQKMHEGYRHHPADIKLALFERAGRSVDDSEIEAEL